MTVRGSVVITVLSDPPRGDEGLLRECTDQLKEALAPRGVDVVVLTGGTLRRVGIQAGTEEASRSLTIAPGFRGAMGLAKTGTLEPLHRRAAEMRDCDSLVEAAVTYFGI